MTTLSQFSGAGRHVSSIVNAHSSGGGQQLYLNALVGAKTYASSSVAANALQTMLSVTGRGCLNFVSAYANDTDSRTIRVQITIDGVVIFNATSVAITTLNAGVVALGFGSAPGGALTTIIPQPVRFYASCLVQIASSVLNDATNITTAINYEVDA